MRPVDYFLVVVALIYLTGEWKSVYHISDEHTWFKHDLRVRIGPFTFAAMWHPVKETPEPVHSHQIIFQFRSTFLIKSGGKLFERGLVG
jgi:hypothetical protein